MDGGGISISFVDGKALDSSPGIITVRTKTTDSDGLTVSSSSIVS